MLIVNLILGTRGTEKQMLLFAGYKHATIVWFERNFLSKTDSENLLIYSLTNKALLAKQKKDKRILNTQMFVKAWTGTWFGFVEKMFMFSPGRRNPENLFFFFSEDNCHPSLYSFTNKQSYMYCQVIKAS